MAIELRVWVGTMAFGLRHHKALRAVIHLSLPKSVESRLPEAGRAAATRSPLIASLLAEKDKRLHALLPRQNRRPLRKRTRLAAFTTKVERLGRPPSAPAQVCGTSAKFPVGTAGNCDACAATPDWFGSRPEGD